MPHLVGTITGAALVFATTNVDDLVVLTVLFVACRAAGRPRAWQICAGQYLGIAALTTIAVLAALGVTLVPGRWVGAIGLVPLGLGVWGLVKLARGRGSVDKESEPVMATGVLSVAALTVANGADNVAIYTPLFRRLGAGDGALTVAVFALMITVWCGAASLLGSHPRVVRLIERHGRWLVPMVFIVLGALIIGEALLSAAIASA